MVLTVKASVNILIPFGFKGLKNWKKHDTPLIKNMKFKNCPYTQSLTKGRYSGLMRK
jgi:hypothetical protein